MKQTLSVNFTGDVDTKSDPFQVAPNNFLVFNNSVRTTGGRFQKRNGFDNFISQSAPYPASIATLGGGLVTIGSSVQYYSPDTDALYSRGTFQPADLSVLPAIRDSAGQTSVDAVIAPNGLACVVANDNQAGAIYQIIDSATGNIVVPITVINSAQTAQPKVFLLSNYFIITFTPTIAGTLHLQYIAIPYATPLTPGSATNLAAAAESPGAYDAFVSGNVLYFAYNSQNNSGQSFTVNTLSALLVVGTGTVQNTISSYIISTISVTVDSSGTSPYIWVTYGVYDSAIPDNRVYTSAFDNTLTNVLAPTDIFSEGGSPSQANLSISSIAAGNLLTSFIGTYPATEPALRSATCTLTGTHPGAVLLRTYMVPASRPFISPINGTIYFLAAYLSQYQPSYFLLDQNTNVIAKLAYSNAGYPQGITLTTMSNVNQSGNGVSIGYLYQGQLSAINKGTTSTGVEVGGLYEQSGVNIATITLGASNTVTTEIAGSLQMSGGFLWMFDGQKPVEQNFHVFPDNIKGGGGNSGGGISAQEYFYQVTYEWTDAVGNVHRSAPSIPISVTTPTGVAQTFTATFSSGATTITVSSAAGLFIGQVITDTTTPSNIQAGTKITSVSGTTVGISLPTGGASGSPDTLQTTDTGQNQLTIQYLGLTAKTTPNPARVVIYRWSQANQIYYQITNLSDTSGQNPLIINNPAAFTFTFFDTLNDAQIIGNNIIYTNGGVIEDTGAPASHILALFDDRVWLVDDEDPNLLWFSKQVIEATPVEMSDLFTFYVAPSTATQVSTGPLTALAPMDDKLILFKENAIYYINGTGPDNTGANNQYSQPIFITAAVGCSNPRSIVLMPDGLMFQTNQGIWLLGRDLSTKYIGAPMEAFNSFIVTSAISVPETTQVRFTLSNGTELVYDYFYGKWDSNTTIPAVSSTLYQGLHTYIDSSGNFFQETPGQYLDGSTPVNMSFTTPWYNLAGLQGYERVYYFYLLGSYISPHTLNIQIYYDYNTTVAETTTITPDPSNPIEQWRVFLSKQRCQAFRITVTEAYNPAVGPPAGAGLTISGINIVYAQKKGWRPIPSAQSVGAS